MENSFEFKSSKEEITRNEAYRMFISCYKGSDPELIEFSYNYITSDDHNIFHIKEPLGFDHMNRSTDYYEPKFINKIISVLLTNCGKIFVGKWDGNSVIYKYENLKVVIPKTFNSEDFCKKETVAVDDIYNKLKLYCHKIDTSVKHEFTKEHYESIILELTFSKFVLKLETEQLQSKLNEATLKLSAAREEMIENKSLKL